MDVLLQLWATASEEVLRCCRETTCSLEATVRGEPGLTSVRGSLINLIDLVGAHQVWQGQKPDSWRQAWSACWP